MSTVRRCDICGSDMGPTGRQPRRQESVELDSGDEVCFDITAGTGRVPNPERNYLTGDVCADCLHQAVAIAFGLHACGLHKPSGSQPPPVFVDVPGGMDIHSFGAGYTKGWIERAAQEHDDA